MLIAFFYADIVIPSAYIELCKIPSTFQPIEEIGDEWDWVTVFHRDIIQMAIILYRSESSIFLFDKEEWGCHWRLRQTDVHFLQVLIKEFVKFLLLVFVQEIDLCSLTLCFGYEFNCMSPGFMLW